MDVTDATCDLLSSATLVVLPKKTKKKMEALKQKQGPNYRQPQRRLGVGYTIPKIVANCIIAKFTLLYEFQLYTATQAGGVKRTFAVYFDLTQYATVRYFPTI